jgi:hypothetical protein
LENGNKGLTVAIPCGILWEEERSLEEQGGAMKNEKPLTEAEAVRGIAASFVKTHRKLMAATPKEWQELCEGKYTVRDWMLRRPA